jgi:hypothetical protein
MNGTEATRPDPEAAAAALRGSEAARAAAARPRPLPGWLPPAQGLLCAGGFTALGLSLAGTGPDGPVIAVALVCLAGLLGVNWLAMHQGGVAPWFAPRGSRSTWRGWGLSAVPFGVALLALIPYGLAGALVGFGVTAGLTTCVQGLQARNAS